MRHRFALTLSLGGAVLGGGLALAVASRAAQDREKAPPPDAVVEAQTPNEVPAERPEQKKTAHDLSDVFAVPQSAAVLRGSGRSDRPGPDARFRLLSRSPRRDEAGDDL